MLLLLRVSLLLSPLQRRPGAGIKLVSLHAPSPRRDDKDMYVLHAVGVVAAERLRCVSSCPLTHTCVLWLQHLGYLGAADVIRVWQLPIPTIQVYASRR